MVRTRPPTTLRARLLFLVFLAVIPAAGAILYIGWEQRRQAEADVEEDALALVTSTASEQERMVVETRQLLMLLAQLPHVRSMHPEECPALLADLMAEGDRYINIGVVRPDGIIGCSALPSPPVDLSSRRWFVRALETDDFAIGEYQVGMITGVASLNFGYPVRDAGMLLGVVFVALPLAWLQQGLSRAELPPGSEVLVLDGTATLLARFPEDNGHAGAELAGTPLAEALRNAGVQPTRAATGLDGVRRLYATTPLQALPDDRSVLVSVGIPTSVAYVPVELAVARNLALLLLALMLMVTLTWWTSGVLVLKPVRSLLVATQRLSGRELGARAEVIGAPREIEELATSFNSMAAALQQHVQEIREHVVQIDRLNRVRAVLSGINSAILRTQGRDELLREACRIGVRDGHFELVWVAELEVESGEIRVAAAAAAAAGSETEAGGREGDHDPDVPALLRQNGGAVWRVLQTGQEHISEDLPAEFARTEERETLRALGLHSAASFPLRVDGDVVASLNLYTREADFYTREEIRLLRELAADTSLGLAYYERDRQLHYLANYDPLTDLPNRTLFIERLGQAIGRARAGKRTTAVLLVEIDRVSEIHAALGHQAGDLVVQTVANGLRTALDEGDTGSRVGSSQFGIILTRVSSVNRIEAAATELLERIPSQVIFDGEPIFITLRVGIAVFPHDGGEPDLLVRAASLALATISSAASHPIAFHSPELDATARERRILQQRLRGALERGELSLSYQPVVDVASGVPIGMEALVRWHSPELGDVPPSIFIPLAEEMGIMRAVGQWVLSTAAREGRRLHEEGLTELRMNVNVSVTQFADPVFIESMTRIIQETGIDLSRLGLGIEITESELMENIEVARAALEHFRSMGLWIYIDDFGTGYSSLSYLRTLPINSLKIDQSFVRDIPEDPDATALVRAIISLAHGLGMRVIAEGVETEAQLAVLREFGCDAAQGYLFSVPLPAPELEAFLSGSA
jgi:diguanylate cyclase